MMIEVAFALGIGTLAGETRDDSTQSGRGPVDGLSRLWRPGDFVFGWPMVGALLILRHTARRLRGQL